MLLLLSYYSELRREKAWSRIHLVPALMAEADRDTYRREQAQLAREKEIMKDVKGWEVSIFENYRCSNLFLIVISSLFSSNLLNHRLERVFTTQNAIHQAASLFFKQFTHTIHIHRMTLQYYHILNQKEVEMRIERYYLCNLTAQLS